MKKPRRWAGGLGMQGKTLLAMAQAARKSSPEHYRDVKILIHELRSCDHWVRHFRRLFWDQATRVYQNYKNAEDEINCLNALLEAKSALVDEQELELTKLRVIVHQHEVLCSHRRNPHE